MRTADEAIIGNTFKIFPVQTLHWKMWSLASSWAFREHSQHPYVTPSSFQPSHTVSTEGSPEESHILAMGFGHCQKMDSVDKIAALVPSVVS